MNKKSLLDITINGSKELNDIVEEFEDLDYHYGLDEPDSTLSTLASHIELYDEPSALEDALEVFKEWVKINKPIYAVNHQEDKYYFIGDLQKEIIPKFMKRLDAAKKEANRIDEEEEKSQEKSIEIELEAAKKHVLELMKQKTNLKKKLKNEKENKEN